LDLIPLCVTLAVNCIPHASLVTYDLLCLVSALSHKSDAGIGLSLLLCYLFEQWVQFQVFYFPVKELLDICDHIDLSSGFEGVGVVAEQSCVDDATAMVLLLEVRVGKAKEHLLQL